MSKQSTKVTTTETTVTEATEKKLPEMTGADFIKQSGNVSKAIRALAEQGHDRGAIAKYLDKRYQHVRNVLITPIKKPAA